MEFNKTIAARQSVRKFTEAQITDEQLKAILEAANAAPACMGQYDHLHLTVVQKPEILAQINAAFQKAVGDPNMQVTYGAPTVIYVSCKNEDEEIVKGCNAGVVMENMLLEAADRGLGAVYLFGVSQVLFANEEITKLLQIPEASEQFLLLLLVHQLMPFRKEHWVQTKSAQQRCKTYTELAQ